MTTLNEDTNGTPKKRPRKGSKIAKRIDELEAEYAMALAGGESAAAMALRVRINNLENGDPEQPDAPDADAPPAASELVVTRTGPGEATVTWNDVVAASTEADANRVERTQSFDRILVELTPEERADLGAEHVAADAELAELTNEKKEAMADFKARIAKVDSKKREIAEAITKKKAWREPGAAGWICEEVFATNTRTYLDPKTLRVVCTETMTADERQLALPKVNATATDEAAQMSLGDVAPADDTDDAAMTDPEALLRAAAAGDELEPSDATLANEPSAPDLGGDDDEDEDAADDDEDEDEDQ